MPVQHVEIDGMRPISMVPRLGDVLLNRSYVGASFGSRCQRLHPMGADSVRQDIAGDGCDCEDQSVGESFDTSQGGEMRLTDSRRGDQTDLSLPQLADRLAIRELVDAYAYCADRRDATGQMALFTEDTDFQGSDVLPGPSRQDRWISAQPDDRCYPLPGLVRQTERRVVLQSAQTHGRLDRNPFLGRRVSPACR
jgi:hypothetical protein